MIGVAAQSNREERHHDRTEETVGTRPGDAVAGRAGRPDVGFELAVKGPSANGTFIAPLILETREVRIRKLVLYTYDNGGADVCVTLYRTTPRDGGDAEMGHVCSEGATTGVRTFDENAMDIRWLTGRHGNYLELYIPGLYSSGYGFYGVQIFYTY